MIVCVVGGATVWQHVCANTVERKLGEPTDAYRGLSKFGWFSGLNISVRNSSLIRSVIGKRFEMPRSTFQYGAATKMLRPTPSPPGAGIANPAVLAKTTG